MIAIPIFKKLHEEGLLSGTSLEKIKIHSKEGLLSLHWELKTLLYLGVLLLSGGLGILVYKNIDTIGHQAILAFIALISAGCFYYCGKTKLPFSRGKVASPNAVFDYVLLLGCLIFLSFIAYLQYQYNVFGDRYGLATFIPMLLLFFTAYYFDHIGILSMAITNFAAWLGLTVTPMRILESNDFDNSRIIFTGIAIGVLLLVAAWFSKQRMIKKHFEFTYTNFGTHILFISLLAALFRFEYIYMLCFIVLAVAALYSYTKAMKENSFYFILITTLYTYIGLTYVVMRMLMFGGGIGSVYLGFIYFIGSGFGLIMFLIKTNKKLKST
jgi:hypothetical protein